MCNENCNCQNKTSKPINILFAGINEDVIIPSKRDEDNCYDIYSYFKEDNMIIHPHETVMIPTGLYSAIPVGYGFALKERGSTGTKGIGQRSGEIDSGYRSEWFIPITNLNIKPIIITKIENKSELESLEDDYIVYPYKKAICQARLVEIPIAKITTSTVEYIKSIESLRGEGSIGSSGK